jgi:Acetyltransferase (GNAT) family
MCSKKTILDAVKNYHNLIYKCIYSKIVNKKFTLFSVPECQNMILWNTIFHFDSFLKISYEEISDFYDFYSIKNCNGYLFSYTDEFKDLSIFNGCYFYFNKSFSNIKINNIDDFTLIYLNDVEIFTENLDRAFHIGEISYKRLSNLLLDIDKTYFNKSYFAYYKENICGTVTLIQCNQDDYFIFNLSVFPEFQKLGLSKKILQYLVLQNLDKNMYIHTEFNSILSKNILPSLGFEFLGSHHILNITKLYEYIKESR